MGLLDDFEKRLREAGEARPEVPIGDLLVPLAGGLPETYDEINASGQTMIFLCVRVEGSIPICVVAGSVKKKCHQCRKDVWMSKETCKAMGRFERTVILCLDCSGALQQPHLNAPRK